MVHNGNLVSREISENLLNKFERENIKDPFCG